MVKQIATKEEVAYYYNDDAISQSTLKTLMKGFYNIKYPKKLESSSLLLGSVVDDMLTNSKEFFNEYHVSNVSISETEGKIIMTALELAKGEKRPLLKDYKDELLEAARFHKWQSRWGDTAKFNNLIKTGSIYYDDLMQAEGKIVIDPVTYNTAKDMVNRALSVNNISELFDDTFDNDPNVTIYHQLPVYFTKKGHACKSLLDVVKVTKTTDTVIIEPKDLKTFWDYPVYFLQSLRKYRYDIQGAWYHEAITRWAETMFSDVKVIIKPFQFIVVSMKPSIPLLFTVTSELYNVGKHGMKEVRNDERIIKPRVKGVEELFDEYVYYKQKSWGDHKLLLESNSNVFDITWDNIIIKN